MTYYIHTVERYHPDDMVSFSPNSKAVLNRYLHTVTYYAICKRRIIIIIINISFLVFPSFGKSDGRLSFPPCCFKAQTPQIAPPPLTTTHLVPGQLPNLPSGDFYTTTRNLSYTRQVIDIRCSHHKEKRKRKEKKRQELPLFVVPLTPTLRVQHPIESDS